MATKEITLSFETEGGALDPVSFEVSDGKSAYEIWQEQGNTGSEQDFLASLGSKIHLVSSASSPVDVNKLDPGSYYISEEAGGYTILNAPNFFPRTLTIEVDIGPEGTVKLAKAGSAYQMKLGTGFWTDIPSGSQTIMYQTGTIGGLYWSDGSGIWGKKDDTKVLGTSDTPSNSLVCKIKNPVSGPGAMTGISQFYNVQGGYKIFVGSASGSSDAPSPDRLFTVPTLSERDRLAMTLGKVDPSNLTLTDLAVKYNQLVDLIVKSGLGVLE